MLNNKNNIFVKAMFFVVLAIVLTVGVTYAYFRANITGVESVSTISVGGATLAIKYEGTNSIKAENVIPGWSAKKYFNVDVTNTSGKDISYVINLVVENSNFDNPETYDWNQPLAPSYLMFGLYECDSAEDKECNKYLSMSWSGAGEGIFYATTNASERTYYALEMVFPNLDEEQSQTGTDGNPLYFSGYVTIDSTKEVSITQFAKDSWATIASNIQSGNGSVYKVGDEKEIEIDVDGDGIVESYTVRVANNSTPSECSTEGFSQTACGFVVEFVDIVEEKYMFEPLPSFPQSNTMKKIEASILPNNSNENDFSIKNIAAAGSCEKCWTETNIRAYLNGTEDNPLTYTDINGQVYETFYSKLPSDLRNVIVDTMVVSGPGPGDYNNYLREDGNWESNDKLYLLSTKEVWVDATSNTVSIMDTAYSATRQLDYYEGKGVTTYNYVEAAKNYNGTASVWWLRASILLSDRYFLLVNSNGNWYDYFAPSSYGLAPAFRIG